MEREPIAYLSTNGGRWTVQYHGPLCAPTDEGSARSLWAHWRKVIQNRGEHWRLRDWPEQPPVWNGRLGQWVFIPRYICEVDGCDRWAAAKQGPGPCHEHGE